MKIYAIAIFPFLFFSPYILCGSDSHSGRTNGAFSVPKVPERNQQAASLHAKGLKLFADGKYKEAFAIWIQDNVPEPLPKINFAIHLDKGILCA